MAGQTGTAVSKDTSADAQGRFAVSLPKEFGPKLDKIGERIGAAVEREIGAKPDISRAMVVQSLVRAALERDEATPQAGGSE